MPTLLILASKLGYQTRAFAEAAAELGVEVVYGTDRCHQLSDPWGDQALPLHFEDPEASSAQIVEFVRTKPLAGIVALGDRPTPTAARACAALGLPFHSIAAADVCRDKYNSRTVLRNAGLQVPQFFRIRTDQPLSLGSWQISRWPTTDDQRPTTLSLPWVLKPLSLSGSRGVIRANTIEEAQAAFERIRSLLRSPEIGVLREPSSNFIQIEQYVDGLEVAIEALVERGVLKLLAIFDKPDPLNGPYFEETIYTTPSRLPALVQQQIESTLWHAVRALGLYHGPVHAEMRIDLDAASGRAHNLWIMEVAARCIGGLCARSLGFTEGKDGKGTASAVPTSDLHMAALAAEGKPHSNGEKISLESLLTRLALGQSVRHFQREPDPSGVIMIPIPTEGIYEDVSGVEAALAVEHIEGIEITAKPGQKLVPLPEGSSYLGFIFARASQPEAVEHALRTAHSRLRFAIAPALPVLSAHR